MAKKQSASQDDEKRGDAPAAKTRAKTRAKSEASNETPGEEAGDDRLVVEVGDPLAPDGLTRVTLDASGRFDAEQIYQQLPGEDSDPKSRSGPPEGQHSGKLDKAEATALLNAAAGFRWEQKFPPRPGIPDEAVVSWQWGGRSLKTWIGDAEKDPQLSAVLRKLRAALARVSDDRLYL